MFLTRNGHEGRNRDATCGGSSARTYSRSGPFYTMTPPLALKRGAHRSTSSGEGKRGMTYTTRLRARLLAGLFFPEGDRISVSGMPPIEVAATPASPEDAFVAREMGGPMDYTFIARGFATEEEAQNAGERLRDALLLAGALEGVGVDVGSGPPTLSFSQAVQDAMSKASGGRAILSDGLGLTVYQNDSVQFIGAKAYGTVSHDVRWLGHKLEGWLASATMLSERQRICALLLNDAQYAPQAEARFVLCISAVEALCDETSRSPGYVRTIDALLRHLSDVGGDPLDVETVRKALTFQRKQSVRQGYLAKIRALLDNATAKEFDGLYDMRSAFIHDGRHRGELLVPANRASEIARALLTKDLSS